MFILTKRPPATENYGELDETQERTKKVNE